MSKWSKAELEKKWKKDQKGRERVGRQERNKREVKQILLRNIGRHRRQIYEDKKVLISTEKKWRNVSKWGKIETVEEKWNWEDLKTGIKGNDRKLFKNWALREKKELEVQYLTNQKNEEC